VKIKNRVAFITGSSRGIGKSIALRLAKEGANVAINYLKNREKAEKVAMEARKYGVEAKVYQADVSNYQQVEDMVRKIVEDFNTIHILVNNAGIILQHYSIFDIPLEEWEKILAVDLTGVFNCTKAVVPVMIKNGEGKIINISSVAGKMGGTVGPHYAASKAGIIGMTFSLTQELLKYNITVKAIASGPIETEMVQNISEERRKIILSRVPMGRFGKTEEVAEAVIFLIKCDYVTGEVIDINGGYYMD